MVLMNLESLVQRGVRVVAGAETDMVRIGSNQAGFLTPVGLSHRRHLSPSCRRTGNQPDPRRFPADAIDVEFATVRAGRPGRFAGVPVSRSPAPIAGRAIRTGWTIAMEGQYPTADRCFGSFTAKTPASGGNVLPGRPLASRLGRERAGKQLCRPRVQQPQKREKPTQAWLMPACRTPAASTRGKEERDFGF